MPKTIHNFIMKKTKLLYILFGLTILLLVSCGGIGTSNYTEDDITTNENVEDNIANEIDKVNETNNHTSDNKYIEFKDEKGVFKIDFPYAPKKEETPMKTELGEVQMISYSYDGGNYAYMMMYSDYHNLDVQKSKPYEMLENAKAGYIGNMSLTVTKSFKNELNDNPGIYFEAEGEVEGEKIHTVVQDYLVGKRLYQIAILRLDRPITEEEIKLYIKSFELLD